MQFQKRCRIKIHALPANANVQMWPGCSSGPAAESDYLRFGDAITHFDPELRKMHVRCQQSLTVVNHKKSAFIKHLVREDHFARVHHANRRPDRGPKIQPLMSALELSIERPLRAKDCGRDSFQW